MTKRNAQKIAAIKAELEMQLDEAAQAQNWDAWDSLKDALYFLGRYGQTTKPTDIEDGDHDSYLQSQY